MSKQALVIDTLSIRALLQAHEPIASLEGKAVKVGGIMYAPMAFDVPPWFFETNSYLSPRSECETDESKLQLIPYVVLRNADGLIFNYFRGKAGEEGRLVDSRSIGVGGHVEVVPWDRSDLKLTLCTEGKREIEEETGIEAEIKDFHALLVNRTDEVGRVHLGLLAIVDVEDKKEDQAAEAGVIDNKAWSTVADLTADGVWETLEPWSQLAMMVLRQHPQVVRTTFEVGESTWVPTVDDVQRLRREFQEVEIRPTVPHHPV